MTEISTQIGVLAVLLAVIFVTGHVLSAIGDVMGSMLNEWMERRRKNSLTDEAITKAVHVAYKNGPYEVFFQPSYMIKKGKNSNPEYYGFYDREGNLHCYD